MNRIVRESGSDCEIRTVGIREMHRHDNDRAPVGFLHAVKANDRLTHVKKLKTRGRQGIFPGCDPEEVTLKGL